MSEVLVVIGLIIFLIGIFWKFILIGVGLIFGIFLLENPNNHNNKIVEPHIVAENSAPTQFVIDCRNLLGKTTNSCNEMWFEVETGK